MNKILLSSLVFLAIELVDCKQQDSSGSQTHQADSTSNKTKVGMKNLVSIIEIPTSDFQRAVAFYKTILAVEIEEMNMDGLQMGVLPSDGQAVNVVLVKGPDHKPSTDGTLIYLRSENDLQEIVDKIEKNGGKVLVPKTAISPEMGFFAQFTDSEGNKLGLHSPH